MKKIILLIINLLLAILLMSCRESPTEVDTAQITRGEQALNDRCLEDSTNYYAVRIGMDGEVYIIDPNTKLTKYTVTNYNKGESFLGIFFSAILIVLVMIGIIFSRE